MTVGRSHTFTLDEAVLSGEAAILPAGSGLPRRIAPSPTNRVAAWLADGASPLYRLDYTTFSASLPDAAGGAPASIGGTGYGVGGAKPFGNSAMLYLDDASAYIVTPSVWPSPANGVWSIAFVITPRKFVEQTPAYQTIVANAATVGTTSGLSIQFSNNSTPVVTFNLAQASPYRAIRKAWTINNDSQLHTVHITYDGTAKAAGVRLYLDGTLVAGSAVSDTLLTTDLTDPARGARWLTNPNGTDPLRRRHLAFLARFPVCLTPDQVLAHAKVTSRATWSWTPTADATLRWFSVPGQFLNDGSVREVSCYVSIGGAPETEYPVNEAVSIAVSAGQTVTMALEAVAVADYTQAPYIADSLGGGPTLVYEEADPPPVYVNVSSGRVQTSVRKGARG